MSRVQFSSKSLWWCQCVGGFLAAFAYRYLSMNGWNQRRNNFDKTCILYTVSLWKTWYMVFCFLKSRNFCIVCLFCYIILSQLFFLSLNKHLVTRKKYHLLSGPKSPACFLVTWESSSDIFGISFSLLPPPVYLCNFFLLLHIWRKLTSILLSNRVDEDFRSEMSDCKIWKLIYVCICHLCKYLVECFRK